MKSWLAILLAAAVTAFAAGAAKAEHEVVIRKDVQYVEHDGTKLSGDFYLPKGLAKAPVVIAIHGGGWQNRSRASYQHWGPYLAKNGYAVYEIVYRLSKAGTYPKAVYDVKAAVQFIRAKAADFGLDPDRIGLMGDSAGGHLAALVALAGDDFSDNRADPYAGTSAQVKAVISFYGVYDMLAQWQHDQIARPLDQITEKFLGVSPMKNRRVYFDSSPISYATADKTRTRFLLIHGTTDDVVDPAQSKDFLVALNQAGISVRRIVVPGAGHFWAADPFEGEPGSYGATVAPRILRFLEGAL
jgi:acetyl esterase/lipase